MEAKTENVYCISIKCTPAEYDKIIKYTNVFMRTLLLSAYSDYMIEEENKILYGDPESKEEPKGILKLKGEKK